MKKTIVRIQNQDGVYEGPIIKSKQKNGLGVQLWENGTAFYGEWKNDQIDGEGILFLPPKTYVHGIFAKSKLNGPTYIRTRHFVFEGFWQSGSPEGELIVTDIQSNTLMTGTFHNGQLTTIVQAHRNTNDVFSLTLQLLADKHSRVDDRKLLGIINYHDGGRFMGVLKREAKQLTPNGLGILHYSDGFFDVGQYKDGLLDGFGRVQLSGGDAYQGQFQAGKYHGDGTMVYRQNEIEYIKGVWSQGQLVSIKQKQALDQVDPNLILEKYKFRENFTICESKVKLPFSFSKLKELESLFGQPRQENSITSISPKNLHFEHYTPERSSQKSNNQQTLTYLSQIQRGSKSREFIQKSPYSPKQTNTEPNEEQNVGAQMMRKREQLFIMSQPENEKKGVFQIVFILKDKQKNLQAYYQRLLDENMHVKSNKQQTSLQINNNNRMSYNPGKSQKNSAPKERLTYSSSNQVEQSYQTIKPHLQFLGNSPDNSSKGNQIHALKSLKPEMVPSRNDHDHYEKVNIYHGSRKKKDDEKQPIYFPENEDYGQKKIQNPNNQNLVADNYRLENFRRQNLFREPDQSTEHTSKQDRGSKHQPKQPSSSPEHEVFQKQATFAQIPDEKQQHANKNYQTEKEQGSNLQFSLNLFGNQLNSDNVKRSSQHAPLFQQKPSKDHQELFPDRVDHFEQEINYKQAKEQQKEIQSSKNVVSSNQSEQKNQQKSDNSIKQKNSSFQKEKQSEQKKKSEPNLVDQQKAAGNKIANPKFSEIIRPNIFNQPKPQIEQHNQLEKQIIQDRLSSNQSVFGSVPSNSQKPESIKQTDPASTKQADPVLSNLHESLKRSEPNFYNQSKDKNETSSSNNNLKISMPNFYNNKSPEQIQRSQPNIPKKDVRPPQLFEKGLQFQHQEYSTSFSQHQQPQQQFDDQTSEENGISPSFRNQKNKEQRAFSNQQKGRPISPSPVMVSQISHIQEQVQKMKKQQNISQIVNRTKNASEKSAPCEKSAIQKLQQSFVKKIQEEQQQPTKNDSPRVKNDSPRSSILSQSSSYAYQKGGEVLQKQQPSFTFSTKKEEQVAVVREDLQSIHEGEEMEMSGNRSSRKQQLQDISRQLIDQSEILRQLQQSLEDTKVQQKVQLGKYKQKNDSVIGDMKEKVYSKILEEGTGKKFKSSENLSREMKKIDQPMVERAAQTEELRKIRLSVSPSVLLRQSQMMNSIITSRLITKSSLSLTPVRRRVIVRQMPMQMQMQMPMQMQIPMVLSTPVMINPTIVYRY